MTHSLRRTDLSGKDQLWATVPRRLRMRDNPEAGGSSLLEGLCATLGLGLDAVRADIFRLYDDLFVETCDPALIPLIGQLVGAEVDPELPIDRRRYLVKSAIHWARRRGTAAQLAALAWISTGFRARLQEPENAAPLPPTADARLLAPRSATILGPAGQPGAATLRIADWQPERRLTLELAVAWPVRRTTRELALVGPGVFAVDPARPLGLRRADGTAITLHDDPLAHVGPGAAIDVQLFAADMARHGPLRPVFMRLDRRLPPRVPARSIAIDPELGLFAGPAAPLPGILGARRCTLAFYEPLRGEWSEHPPVTLAPGVFSCSPAGADQPLTDEQGRALIPVLPGTCRGPTPGPDERLLLARPTPLRSACGLLLGFRLLAPGQLETGDGVDLDRNALTAWFRVTDEWGWEAFPELRLVHELRGEAPPDHVLELDLRRGRFRVNPARADRVRLVGSYHRFDLEGRCHDALQVLRDAAPLGRTLRLILRDTAPGRREVLV